MAHARLSPSNHRWVHCPGSVREEAQYPDVSGEAAVDGTGSHLLLEICLRASSEDRIVRAEEWLDRTIGEGHEDRAQGWWVKQDRCDRVQMALDYIARRRQEIDMQVLEPESSSNPGFYLGRKDWYGTLDIGIRGVAPCGTKVIEVVDYKDGRGYVSEKDNPQLIAYAAGRLAPFIADNNGNIDPRFDDYLVRMTIVQPKTNPVVRYQEMTGVKLWQEAQKLKAAADRTDDPNAPLIDGPWCTWCKHGRAGACTAKSETAMEGVSLMTSTDGNNTMIEAIQAGEITPAGMPDEQIAAILDAAPAITKMIEQVEAEAMKRLKDGAPIPGYAIGTARGKRVWAEDEETVAAKLKGMRVKKGDMYPAKLISPAQAEKLDCLNDKQKAKLQGMITTVDGKPKVVKSNTQKIEKSVEDMFGAIPEKTEPAPMSFM